MKGLARGHGAQRDREGCQSQVLSRGPPSQTCTHWGRGTCICHSHTATLLYPLPTFFHAQATPLLPAAHGAGPGSAGFTLLPLLLREET